MTISAARPLWRNTGKDARSSETSTTSPSSTIDRSPGRTLAGIGVDRKARQSPGRPGAFEPDGDRRAAAAAMRIAHRLTGELRMPIVSNTSLFLDLEEFQVVGRDLDPRAFGRLTPGLLSMSTMKSAERKASSTRAATARRVSASGP
jgi:hypothetical protein